MICNVQCLPEPGTCKSKLIAAKPSFEEPVFQILGVPGQGVCFRRNGQHLEKNGSYTGK